MTVMVDRGEFTKHDINVVTAEDVKKRQSLSPHGLQRLIMELEEVLTTCISLQEIIVDSGPKAEAASQRAHCIEMQRSDRFKVHKSGGRVHKRRSIKPTLDAWDLPMSRFLREPVSRIYRPAQQNPLDKVHGQRWENTSVETERALDSQLETMRVGAWVEAGTLAGTPPIIIDEADLL